MPVTMREIAQASGVSVMTVSRVLGNRTAGQVSDEVRERVRRCAGELGYRPNLAAQQLRAGDTAGEIASPKAPAITMLLPRPNFLRQSHSMPVVERQLGLLEGAMEATFATGVKVETLPVSLSDSTEDIQWNNLRTLGAGDRILACSFWFAPVLLELHRRGCRIALSTAEVYWRGLYSEYTRHWLLLTTHNVQGAQQMTSQLIRQGCKNIAVLDHYIDEPEEPVRCGVEDKLREVTGVNVRYLRYGLTSPPELNVYLRNEYADAPFDGLILHSNLPNWDFRLTPAANLGLPESVRLICSYDCREHAMLHPGLNAVSYPWRQIGYDAAQSLLAADFQPGEKFYAPELIIRDQEQ